MLQCCRELPPRWRMRAPPSTASRLSKQACVSVNNPHSADACQQWVGVTVLAVSAGQRSVPRGLFECSSVDAIWATAAAADSNCISPCPNPGQTGSHIPQSQSPEMMHCIIQLVNCHTIEHYYINTGARDIFLITSRIDN